MGNMKRPRMTKDIAHGLVMLEKIYNVFFDETLGGLYTEILDEADDGVAAGKYSTVPLLDIESARDYIHDLKNYYGRVGKKKNK